jgi:formate C-acetyltransferase
MEEEKIIEFTLEERISDEPLNQEGLRRFISLIDQYFESGGMQIQFNIVSKETLREAQLHPEDYSDLLVRVAGYSAYFTQLAKDVQDDIIERTEQKL